MRVGYEGIDESERGLYYPCRACSVDCPAHYSRCGAIAAGVDPSDLWKVNHPQSPPFRKGTSKTAKAWLDGSELLAETINLRPHYSFDYQVIEGKEFLHIMPHKPAKTTKSSNTKPTNEKIEWGGIVDVPLPADAKSAIEAWAKDTDMDIALQDLLNQQYSLKVSWNDRNKAFLASLSCYDAESPNAHRTMISRAKSPVMAIWVALFKHYMICDGNWLEAGDDGGDIG